MIDQLEVALDRPLPNSLAAERAVLGAILISQECLFRVNLSTRDFFSDAHRHIWTAISTLVEEGMVIDQLTLRVELTRAKVLEAVGGFSYIASLTETVPDIARVEVYAAMIQRESKKRALIEAGNRMMRAAMDVESEPEEIAAKALTELGVQTTRENLQTRLISAWLAETYEGQAKLAAAGKSLALTSGFPELDAHRIFSPTLVVCGAPSKDGKTALMIELADGLARNRHRCAIITLESSERDTVLRYSSSQAGMPHSRMRDWRRFGPLDYDRVARVSAEASDKRIFLGRVSRVAEDIVMELRRLRATEGIEAAFIDYVQLMELRRPISNREERLSEIAQLLLGTAVDLGITIFVMSQVNEDGWAKRGHGPLNIGDLAYAKAIGKSARTVLLFHRPRKADPESPHPACYVAMQIAANNEDRTHDGFSAHFNETYQRFSEGECDCNAHPTEELFQP
jgi:replicative DNA helicase